MNRPAYCQVTAKDRLSSGRRRLAYWVEGREHDRKAPHWWLRPLCWVLGGHSFGLAFGDDDRCLTCGKPDDEDDFYEGSLGG